jgi:hypothetical protein
MPKSYELMLLKNKIFYLLFLKPNFSIYIFRTTRESYIKRKWLDREFVGGLSVSPSRCSRKWSVRKLRRRGRSRDAMHVKTSADHQGVVIVGEELEKEPLAAAIDISSDEDSTAGEDEQSLGKFIYLTV